MRGVGRIGCHGIDGERAASVLRIDRPVLVERVGVAEDEVFDGDFFHEEVHLGEVGGLGDELLTVVFDVMLVMVFADFLADAEQQARRADAGVIDLDVFFWAAVFEARGDDARHQGGQLVRRVESAVLLRLGGKLLDQVLVDIAEHVVGLRPGRYLCDEADDIADGLVAAADVLAELGEAGVERVEDAGVAIDVLIVDIEDARAFSRETLIETFDGRGDCLRAELLPERLPGGEEIIVGDEVAEIVAEVIEIIGCCHALQVFLRAALVFDEFDFPVGKVFVEHEAEDVVFVF